MQKTRVAVLRGGPSSEYEVSLKSGGAVLSHLPQDRFEVRDVFIDREGTWHTRGRPTPPARALSQVDVAFLALHGTFGEDGVVQRFLDSHAIPYTGSDAIASALAMNKALTKRCVIGHGILTPCYRVIKEEEMGPELVLELFRTFPQPCVVKPLDSGSSVGVTIVKNFDALEDALYAALAESPQVLVEEFVKGREATVGVLENFRNEELYALPDVEIIPNSDRQFFDYAAKYEGASREVCPGCFEHSIKQEMAQMARIVHKALGLRHYSRSDFIVSPRGVYFLEVNTLPGLAPMSLIPKSVAAVGCTFPDFLCHLLDLALQKR